MPLTVDYAAPRVVFDVTADFGSGAVPLVAAVALTKHQVLPAAADGKTIGCIVEHLTANEVEVSWATYDHGTLTISRGTGGAIQFSSAGVGTTVPFSPGTKRIALDFLAVDFMELIASLDALEATPPAHAALHVSGGADKIRDATAAQDGLATATQIAKLDGIEAGASADQSATEVVYSNTTSGLAATNVQAAIDEVLTVTALRDLDAGTFAPADVQLSAPHKLYDAYTSTGTENVTINATREAGVEVTVPWDPDGNTITWPSNCIDIHGNLLTGTTWTGTKTVLFRWHPDYGGGGVGRAIVVIGGGLAAVEDDTAPVLGAALDGGGFAITNYTLGSLVTSVTGVMTQAAHGGRVCQLSGDVTVPITDGFMALLQNPSGGATRTITPAGGQVIHDGAAVATLAVPILREVSVRGDGTNLWVAGAVV